VAQIPTSNNLLLDQLNKALSGLAASLSSYSSNISIKPPTPQTPSSAANQIQSTTSKPAAVTPAAYDGGYSSINRSIAPPAKASIYPAVAAPASSIAPVKPATTAPVVVPTPQVKQVTPVVSPAVPSAAPAAAVPASSPAPAGSTFPVGAIVDMGNGPQVVGVNGKLLDPSDPQSMVAKLLGSLNQPIDYNAELTNAKGAYENIFGTPTQQAAPVTAAQAALYEDAKKKAVEDIQGNMATRGLLASGETDKETTQALSDLATKQSATIASAIDPYQQAEQTSVLDILDKVMASRQAEKTSVLSLIPKLLTPDYGSGDIGNYNFYVTQTKAAGQTPMNFSDWLTEDANRKKATNAITLSPDALALFGTGLMQTGTMPALGMGAATTRIQLMENAAAQAKAQGLDPSQVVSGWAGYAADKASLAKLQTTADAINAFEGTAKKNLDMFLGQAQKVIDAGTLPTNYVFRGAEKQIGDPNMAGFETARTVAYTEIAKVLNNPTISAVLTDSARQEANNMLNGNYTLAGIMNVANILKQDMANRMTETNRAIGNIESRISGGSGTTETSDVGTLLEHDITTLGSTFPTREALIEALVGVYPEFNRDQIASKVYTLIPDKK